MTDETTSEPMIAQAATRDDSVRVRASESGLPVSIHIDSAELRYGGAELAATVLDLCRRATERARAERRTLLEQSGMSRGVLDMLGLPSASDVADAENELMDTEQPPSSWMTSL